jgi:hypothetical protein
MKRKTRVKVKSQTTLLDVGKFGVCLSISLGIALVCVGIHLRLCAQAAYLQQEVRAVHLLNTAAEMQYYGEEELEDA